MGLGNMVQMLTQNQMLFVFFVDQSLMMIIVVNNLLSDDAKLLLMIIYEVICWTVCNKLALLFFHLVKFIMVSM